MFTFGNSQAYSALGQFAAVEQGLVPDLVWAQATDLKHITGDWVPVLDALHAYTRQQGKGVLTAETLPPPVLAMAQRAGMFGSETILPTEANVLPCRHYRETDALALGLETAHALRQYKHFAKPLNPVLENTLCHLLGDIARFVWGQGLAVQVHIGGHTNARQRQLLLMLAFIGKPLDAEEPAFAPVWAELQKFCRKGGGQIVLASGSQLWAIGPKRNTTAALPHPFPGGLAHFQVDITARLG